ncbi:hypothetical protein [Roseobacter denitrificans]|uniref:Uncharacterized protein n=1 Tax=Roseobacter denitrificans (strain ATCC 33942 / OCh 114) TaxID=375451 RepID=Q16DX6_ROSDO|nr:hypothetical protein [Roseobacter denitrificans]ABG29817.1 hypothetical protein RD1_0081 [Roseobacter denitrificans OCh 114]SFG26498.1 hypothetical protein SAMN05443635_11175 [Roseobacter denitrificans OCh 114]
MEKFRHERGREVKKMAFFTSAAGGFGHVLHPAEIAAWPGFLVSPAGDVSSGKVIILNQRRHLR